MCMMAFAPTLGPKDVSDAGVERPAPASRLVPTSVDPMPSIAAKAVLVGFPVLLPGKDGRVIAFGRYELAALERDAACRQAVLINRDSGARIVLSTRQLSALVQDPDVELL